MWIISRIVAVSAFLTAIHRTPLGAATLAIVSQHGFVHVYCRLQFDDNTVKWLGFAPKTRTPIGDGKIDSSSGDDLVDTYVMFNVDDAGLRAAEMDVVERYRDQTYNVAKTNCIDFARDLAASSGLRLPDRSPNQTPGEFVSALAGRNRFLARDDRPLRWVADDTDASQTARLVIKRIVCHKSESVTVPDSIYAVVITNKGKQFESERHSLKTNAFWEANLDAIPIHPGQPVCIQLWDDDGLDPDDCVFDWSFNAPQQLSGDSREQTRGTSLSASESRYTVEWGTR